MPQNTTEWTQTELSPSQSHALAALLAGATVTAAAERAGVGRETVHRWLRDDRAFVAALNAGKAEIVTAARAELRALATVAVARLRALLEDRPLHPNARVLQYRAAIEVLKMSGVAEPEPIVPVGQDDTGRRVNSEETRQKIEAMLARLRPASPRPDGHPTADQQV